MLTSKASPLSHTILENYLFLLSGTHVELATDESLTATQYWSH